MLRTQFPAETNGKVFTLAFTPDGARLVTGDFDGQVRVWDIRTDIPKLLKLVSGSDNGLDEIWVMGISPDGRFAVTGGRHWNLRLWDLKVTGPLNRNTGRTSDFLVLKGHTDLITSFAFARNSPWMASGSSDGTVRMWNISNPLSPQSIVTLRADTHPNAYDEGVRGLAISPDDKTLVAGGGDGIVRFWKLSTAAPQKLHEIDFEKGWIRSIDYSPDGRRMVIACESGALLLTDLAGKVQREWKFPGSHSARFTPDGRHVLTRNGNSTSYILRLPD